MSYQPNNKAYTTNTAVYANDISVEYQYSQSSKQSCKLYDCFNTLQRPKPKTTWA